MGSFRPQVSARVIVATYTRLLEGAKGDVSVEWLMSAKLAYVKLRVRAS
jgi:hypothetical protein